MLKEFKFESHVTHAVQAARSCQTVRCRRLQREVSQSCSSPYALDLHQWLRCLLGGSSQVEQPLLKVSSPESQGKRAVWAAVRMCQCWPADKGAIAEDIKAWSEALLAKPGVLLRQLPVLQLACAAVHALAGEGASKWAALDRLEQHLLQCALGGAPLPLPMLHRMPWSQRLQAKWQP